jgi:hypothetical protein
MAKKLQGAGLLAGPIQHKEYVPLPYDKVFEMNRLKQAQYDKQQKGILDLQKSLYDTAMSAPPGLQDEAVQEIQPFLNSISQRVEDAGYDLGKVQVGDIVGQFYNTMVTGKLGGLSRAGAQYAAAQKEIRKADELFLKGKGGYEPGVGKAALSAATTKYEQDYAKYQADPMNNPAPVFSMPDIYPYVNIGEKSRELVSEMDPTKVERITGKVFAGYNKDGEALYETLDKNNKVIEKATTLSADDIRRVSNVGLSVDQDVQGYLDNRYQIMGMRPPEGFDPATHQYSDDAKTNTALQKEYSLKYQKNLNAMAPLGLTDPESLKQAQDMALNMTYRDLWKDQYINNQSISSGNIYKQYEVGYRGDVDGAGDSHSDDPTPFLIGDSAEQPVTQKTSLDIGKDIMNLDSVIAEKEAAMEGAASKGSNLAKTHQSELNVLKQQRTELLSQAGNTSQNMIEYQAKNSIFWADDTFDTHMKSFYDAMKGNIKGGDQESFTAKAKILSAIPGISSIGLLPGDPSQAEALAQLTPKNYNILNEQFKEGESIMPYLQAAQWIQNKARKAKVVNTYEKSLRTVQGYGDDSYISRTNSELTDMFHSGNMTFTDFYANEDVKALVKAKEIPKEAMKVEQTLSMMDGVPAYKISYYDHEKYPGKDKLAIRGVSDVQFVKASNTSDALVRYEGLGTELLSLAKQNVGRPEGDAYFRAGAQTVANARLLSPIQRTGIETNDMSGSKIDAEGNPYIERDIQGFNLKVRRTDMSGDTPIYELLVKSGPSAGAKASYLSDATGQREPLVGISLEEIVYNYFMKSGAKVDAQGRTGEQVILDYYNR